MKTPAAARLRQNPKTIYLKTDVEVCAAVKALQAIVNIPVTITLTKRGYALRKSTLEDSLKAEAVNAGRIS